ncbi:methyltransferase domain-containing protein [Actinomadura rubrisoli]|uniref:Protein-L-isoaspartate O-methyltransferase n=1 Tax=Actinomadura rubrisoli TaxID=2530368 RepID=A0A4R5CB69_9ACTN|nr:methyltransferase domain-containing protein [Actinomadura rubrisoli]TDD94354.1 methyltransferase domain-containing protein [Actinomadura rubrisoli]
MTSVDEDIDRLADALTASGDLTDQKWRRSMHAVPRHLFIPERGYAMPNSYRQGPPAHTIDRNTDPEGWWAAVYSNMSVITQRDDGAGDPASAEGSASSSNSAPGVVFPFLELLAPIEGERILDIGTGTGWTAALLSDRVGSENVTTVEIDPQMAAQAAENIRAAGYAPNLITGDGVAGWPQGTPYDGIHVTCGVSEVPLEWVRQLRPGGRAVLPWMSGTSGFKLRLIATRDGHAVGTFHGGAGYMMLRSQRPISGWHKHHVDDAQLTTTRLDPAQVMEAEAGADLALTMNVPRLVMLRMFNTDGAKSCFLAEVDDPKGSWATCDSSPTGEHIVTQYGDRRLWDEVEAAFTQWTQLGSPTPDRFTLTVGPDGQHLRLDNPAR